MSISADYQAALEAQARSAFIQVIADRPSITVADVRALVSEYPALGELSLDEVLGGGSKAKGRKAKSKTRKGSGRKAPTRKGKKAKSGGWEVRTAAGREALDAAVLEALEAEGGKDIAAEQLRDRLGTTPHQLRTSLNRHIEAGRVSFTGKARGTRYSLT